MKKCLMLSFTEETATQCLFPCDSAYQHLTFPAGYTHSSMAALFNGGEA